VIGSQATQQLEAQLKQPPAQTAAVLPIQDAQVPFDQVQRRYPNVQFSAPAIVRRKRKHGVELKIKFNERKGRFLDGKGSYHS
jgi:hypothetical protein